MFQTERVNDNVTRIRDIADTCMYLVMGTEKAVLIDTGVGCESLKELIASLTEKPLTVIITHGHVDHAMEAGEFDTVYMSKKDMDIYNIHKDRSFRLSYIKSFTMLSPNPEVIENLTEDDLVPAGNAEEFMDLNPGMEFDLGGITVCILDGKGHTPGTMVILLPELKTLLLGDACNNFTFLFEPICLTVKEYLNSLKKLKSETDGKYDKVYLLHGPGTGEVNMIDGVIQVCEDVLAGNSDNIPYEGLGQKGIIARVMDFEILNFQGSTHLIGVGSLSNLYTISFQFSIFLFFSDKSSKCLFIFIQQQNSLRCPL